MYSCKRQDKVELTENGTFGFIDVGYRYQTNHGLMIRAGINPGYPLDIHDSNGNVTDHGVRRAAAIYPYIGVGYNF